MITRQLRTTDSSATMAYYSTLVYLIAAFILAPLTIFVGEVPNRWESIAIGIRCAVVINHHTGHSIDIRGKRPLLLPFVWWMWWGKRPLPMKPTLPAHAFAHYGFACLKVSASKYEL